MIMFLPITDKDKAQCHKYGSKKLEGIFMGYSQRSGGSWDGDVYIADLHQIHNANSIHEIYPKRFNAK